MTNENSIIQQSNNLNELYNLSDIDENIYAPENRSQNVEIEISEIEKYFFKKLIAHYKVYTYYYNMLIFILFINIK